MLVDSLDWLADCDIEAGSSNVSKPETAAGGFVFVGLITKLISWLTASSIQSMLNSTANSSHFPFFLLSDLAMVYSRKTLGLYLITRKHKITKLLPSSVGLSAYNIIPLSVKLQCTKVDTYASKQTQHTSGQSHHLHSTSRTSDQVTTSLWNITFWSWPSPWRTLSRGPRLTSVQVMTFV